MTRNEERIVMIIECIAMIFIVLSTVGIEEANRRSSEWKDAIIIKQNNVNNMYLLTMNVDKGVQYYSLIRMFNPDVLLFDSSRLMEVNPHMNKELVETANKVNAKLISNKEFFKQTHEIYYQIYLKYLKAYNKGNDELNQLLNNKPTLRLFFIPIAWSFLENILNVIRVIAIIVAALLYLTIYREISMRMKSNN